MTGGDSLEVRPRCQGSIKTLVDMFPLRSCTCPRIMLFVPAALALAAMAVADPRVLVYTATKGYSHDSIPTAIEVLGQSAAQWQVVFEFTE